VRVYLCVWCLPAAAMPARERESRERAAKRQGAKGGARAVCFVLRWWMRPSPTKNARCNHRAMCRVLSNAQVITYHIRLISWLVLSRF
jgi:hypothetical protein